jgi:hypothetical protein
VEVGDAEAPSLGLDPTLSRSARNNGVSVKFNSLIEAAPANLAKTQTFKEYRERLAFRLEHLGRLLVFKISLYSATLIAAVSFGVMELRLKRQLTDGSPGPPWISALTVNPRIMQNALKLEF